MNHAISPIMMTGKLLSFIPEETNVPGLLPQHIPWVDKAAVEANLEVQVGTEGVTGVADGADHGAGAYALA